jgi:alkylated DNA repair dioxygenase AlkB
VKWIERTAPAPAGGRTRLDLYGYGAFNRGYGSARRVSDAIPMMLGELASDLKRGGYLEQLPDAITVSEYLPGQELGMHVDRIEAGPIVVGVSLLGDCVMRVRHRFDEPIDVHYPARDLMRMADPCRSEPWRHAILPVTERRISIVFRRTPVD